MCHTSKRTWLFSPPSSSSAFTILTLKALKLIRSFFITQGSRLSLHWVHRLLLSGIDPFLRLRGGNYSEIFAMQSGEPTLFDFPFKSAIGRTTPFPSKRAGLYRIPIVDNLLELDEQERCVGTYDEKGKSSRSLRDFGMQRLMNVPSGGSNILFFFIE